MNHLVPIRNVSIQNERNFLCIQSKFFLKTSSVTQTKVKKLSIGKILYFVLSVLLKKNSFVEICASYYILMLFKYV